MESKTEIIKECCNEAVYWNPYNKVVQCHVCGQIFVKDKSELEKMCNRKHGDDV